MSSGMMPPPESRPYLQPGRHIPPLLIEQIFEISCEVIMAFEATTVELSLYPSAAS